MFTDKARIFIKAGNGGNGSISFHREKYVAAGGPDGGDGGKGGNVVFKVDTGLTTLMDFKYKRKYVAENGGDGSGKRQRGKNGADIEIFVPQGTLIRDSESNRLLADMSREDSAVVLARGGNGGWGNCHFATPTRQTPNFAKNGRSGEERMINLELRLLADVGLIGFPNVGKSTILSKTTKADPKIANYHFTTLIPNLGVCSVGEHMNFVIADIPGLIEGASAGAGLGHEFLRHIQRTRLLVHVVDVSCIEGRNPIEDFETINKELSEYDMGLEERPQIIAANKTDILQDLDAYNAFIEYAKDKGYEVYPISAATGEGVDELMKKVYTRLSDLPPIYEYEAEPDPFEELMADVDDTGFKIEHEGDLFVISGTWIEAVGGSVNFSDRESLQYFQRALVKKGVIDALIEKGIQEGQTVKIGDLEFDFVW